VVQTSIPPDDAQFLETRRYQVAEIARLYRVPLHMINETERSTSWGSGLEQLNIGFVIYTLLTWIRRNEQAVSKWLLPTRTRYALFNLNGLLRGDSQARAAFYREGRTGGWLSINDIRRLEDMPPIENGDDYLQPLNMAPVGSPAAKGLGDGDDDANVNGNGNRDDFRALIGATA
jgi:HK97 family phage portal protein